MDILQVLSHQSYGAKKQLLLHPFTALIGSLVDYGNDGYGLATETALRMLNLMLQLWLRLLCGAFRIKPAESMYVE